ncbi:MAG: hypothetical protein KTR31_40290 [Myxococcales bacterium]|nr:hypothetical protein [Myxococcales bacterium]
MFPRATPVTLGIAAWLSGCTGQPTEAPDDGKPSSNTRDTLVVGWQSDVGNLFPVVAETAADRTIMEAIYFPTVDSQFDCSLKTAPGLAKEITWNDEGTVLKMTMRDDITWADGTKVTVQDLAFTYDLVADPTVASARFPFIAHMQADARPKIIDDTHIEWHFTRPYDRDTQVSHTSLFLMPKHVMEGADRATLRGHDLANTPMPYGPFRIAKWEPNERLILEPNPDFTGPDHWKPNLNRVLFRIIPEYATRVIELEAGNIDMMEAVLVEDADRLRKSHPEIKLERRGWRSNDYIGWNLENPLFQDVRVRKAIAMATDINGMIDRLLTSKETGEKYARPSVGTITPALCGVHNDDITPYAFSLDKAKALLADAGWRDTDGDGFVDKGGKKFSFTLSTNTGNKRRADTSVLFQDQMKALGIEVNLEKIESNTFFENLRKHKFEAALAGWAAGLFVDPSNLWQCSTEDAPKEFNFTGYCNPEVDALIEKGMQTPNPKDSAPIWKELQAKLYEDQPYLFLWWMDEIVAIHERFENTSINVLSPRHHLHEWSVPEDKVKYKQ